MDLKSVQKKFKFWRAAGVMFLKAALVIAVVSVPVGILLSIMTKDLLFVSWGIMLPLLPAMLGVIFLQVLAWENLTKFIQGSLGLKMYGATVVKVLPGTPGAAAGFKPGDMVLSINYGDVDLTGSPYVDTALSNAFQMRARTDVQVYRKPKIETLTLINSKTAQ